MIQVRNCILNVLVYVSYNYSTTIWHLNVRCRLSLALHIRPNSVARQVSFNLIKIVGKCQTSKGDILGNFQRMCFSCRHDLNNFEDLENNGVGGITMKIFCI